MTKRPGNGIIAGGNSKYLLQLKTDYETRRIDLSCKLDQPNLSDDEKRKLEAELQQLEVDYKAK